MEKMQKELPVIARFEVHRRAYLAPDGTILRDLPDFGTAHVKARRKTNSAAAADPDVHAQIAYAELLRCTSAVLARNGHRDDVGVGPHAGPPNRASAGRAHDPDAPFHRKSAERDEARPLAVNIANLPELLLQSKNRARSVI
jgi:hypothetical protein